MPASTQLATDALFTQYLHVVNRALGENRDTFPYKQILSASDKAFEGKKVAVGVYKKDMKTPHDWFTVAYKEGTFDLEKHGKSEAALSWKLPQSHLEEVVESPEGYIEHPYKLDLDWLKKTVGVAA